MGEGNNKQLDERLHGYATVMLIWALLRALMGIVTLVQYLMNNAFPGIISVWIFVTLVLALAVYLALTGNFGHRAVTDKSKLKIFYVMSGIGFGLAAITLAVYIYWLLCGMSPTAGDIFCTAVDAVLYGSGVYYARAMCKGSN